MNDDDDEVEGWASARRRWSWLLVILRKAMMVIK